MYQQVLDFWFVESKPEQWWQKDEAFDQEIKRRFLTFHQQAKVGELYDWRATAEGSLAEVIVLDQFSRNLYRDQPESFACDPLALALSQFAINKGFDQALEPIQRSFLYMPFMHSESKAIHELALMLFEALGNANNLDFERQHKAIIDRFGRYPHRNAILGRESTAEELAFLEQPNSSF